MSAAEVDAVRAALAAQQSAAGSRGVVAAAAPVAASVGAEALRDGGNAYDAAVTAALAETVALPPKCGLAGDLVALCLEPGADIPEALLAIGPAAAGLGEVATAGRLTVTCPASVGVPGAPVGYAALAARGRLGRRRVAAPAIDIALDGFVWAPVLDHLTQQVVRLLREQNPNGTVYLPENRPVPVGATVRLPRLAGAVGEWVERGGELMTGAVGKAVERRVRGSSGVLTLGDLAGAEARWEPAVEGKVGNLSVWTTPEPTHGPSLLHTLEGTGVLDSAAGLWRGAQRSFEHRKRVLGDPAKAEGTSAVAAVDAEGRVVVVIHSNSFPRFGSGLVVSDYDLILSNRAGRGFTDKPGHPNFPVAGRRPATTLHAWAAGPGRARWLGGTPGGINQMIWNAQTLRELALGETVLGRLVTAPRWSWEPAARTVQVEADCPAADRSGLQAVADGVQTVPPLSLHSVQVVAERPEPGTAPTAAADPREGAALAVA